MLIIFLLSVCRCCLCELEAYDTETNSLYVQARWAIRAFSYSDSKGQRAIKGLSAVEQVTNWN